MITFIEKPLTEPSSFTENIYAPNFMVKDGVEYFVMNRMVHCGDRGYKNYYLDKNARTLERAKALLLQNDGMYFKFSGFFDNPFDMLEDMVAKGHTFSLPDKLFDDYRGMPSCGGGFVEFHGNRREITAAFHYRIYDMDMVTALKDALQPIIERGTPQDL